MTRLSLSARLLSATALVVAPTQAIPQDVGEKPVQENAAIVALPPSAAEGFSIRVNGETVTEDRRVTNVARKVDVAVAQADVAISFDGLGGKPRLDLEFSGEPREYAPGDRVVIQSAVNYPAYVARAEMRIVDIGAPGGPRTITVLPVEPNGQVAVTLPEGRDLAVVHRVYDQRGRFDETRALSLFESDERPRVDDVEEGTDFTARRRIPVYGGAVTVRGSGVTPGARVTTLGESVRPDPSGGFVLQRIMRPGTYDVDVAVKGAGQNVDQTRRVEIPQSEWLRTGTIDLTFGMRDSDRDGEDTYSRGRIAGYIEGRTAGGIEVTASVDTGEEDLEDIFRNLDEKDPRQLMLRVDPDDLYPTYGDDSEVEDRTPTSGKFYLRVERDANFGVWGDFKSNLDGNQLIRNERSLYGLQLHLETPDAVRNGDPRASLDLYAAQPDRLPQRDSFRGTGGSVYFLDKQDISSSSETLSIQLRDPVTGRVIQTQRLVAGVDYDINYIQGVVTLARPLTGTVSTNGLLSNTDTDAAVELVVQYEYTPTATDLDSFAYGGRAEVWATEQLRFGVSGIKEQTGVTEQTLTGADVRFEYSESTYAQIDYARSEGQGFAATLSFDGGLITDDLAREEGTGSAIKAQGQLLFADVGIEAEGSLSAYFEEREEGFTSLDTMVRASTGDETLWGFELAYEPSERIEVTAYYDSYDNAAGQHDRSGGATLAYALNDRQTVALGVDHLDRNKGTRQGERTDLALKFTHEFSDDASVWVAGQATVNETDLGRNDRLAVGAAYAWNNGWSLEGELSGGSKGAGGRILASHSNGQGNDTYFGYELDADREYSNIPLKGRDLGRFVSGGSRQVNDDLAVYGESTYDAFGRHRALTNAYGLSYVANDALRFTAAVEYGRVDDNEDNTDFDRHALTFGVFYETEELSASGRIEYRKEEGLRSGDELESDTILVTADARYKISESARVVVSLDYADTRSQSPILDETYADLSLGYAFRPIADDKLNVLARYRYLHDLYGQRVEDDDERGPRQKSHVVSVDALYDLNPQFTIGGKLGYRASESGATEADFTENDAWLAVGSLAYHATHKWDALIEVRQLNTVQAGTSDRGVLAAAYRHMGHNAKIGLGYNFGDFSDDLTDLTEDDRGAFINLIAKF